MKTRTERWKLWEMVFIGCSIGAVIAILIVFSALFG